MSGPYSVAEAKDQLPRLVHVAEAGAVVEITRRGRAVAALRSTDAYERLTTRPVSLWLGIRWLQAQYGTSLAVGDDPFADARDPSTGRDVEL